jgi:hypothetical protein
LNSGGKHLTFGSHVPFQSCFVRAVLSRDFFELLSLQTSFLFGNTSYFGIHLIGKGSYKYLISQKGYWTAFIAGSEYASIFTKFYGFLLCQFDPIEQQSDEKTSIDLALIASESFLFSSLKPKCLAHHSDLNIC